MIRLFHIFFTITQARISRNLKSSLEFHWTRTVLQCLCKMHCIAAAPCLLRTTVHHFRSNHVVIVGVDVCVGEIASILIHGLQGALEKCCCCYFGCFKSCCFGNNFCWVAVTVQSSMAAVVMLLWPHFRAIHLLYFHISKLAIAFIPVNLDNCETVVFQAIN